MKVLVIQQKMIGDVLASSVICQVIKTAHPDWEMHYMIYPNCLAVVENNPFIDKIILFNPKEHKGLSQLISFGKKLRKDKYDIIIDAYGKWESMIPSYFSNAAMRIGFKKSYTSLFYTELITPKKNVDGSAIYHRLQLAQPILKNNIAFVFPKIYMSEQERIIAKTAINQKLNTSHPIVMISVLGSDASKSLPTQQMAETLDVIVSHNSNLQLLFNFIPNQITEAQAIYDACQPETKEKIIFDFYTKGLREFLAILEQCDALIGNEGGAVNMAKALGVKTFTLFSPWINKNSWNMLNDDEQHVAVHLQDYFPEIYGEKHPKKFKKQSLKMYPLLTIDRYKEPLKLFLNRI